MWSIRWLLLFLFAEIILADSWIKDPVARRDQKVINVGLRSVPDNLDPVNIRMMEHFLLLQCISQTLVRVSEQGKIVSDLAESWSIKKGVEYEFNIDDQAKFFDGSAVTVNDVAKSLARHFYPEHRSAVGGYLKDVVAGAENVKNGELPTGLEIVDVNRLRITLKKPYPPFLHVLAMPGFSITKTSRGNVVASGPMRPEFQLPEKAWALKRNVHYTGTSPMSDEIVIREIKPKSLPQMLSNNELDVVLGLSPSEIRNFKISEPYKVVRTQSLAIVHMYYNLQEGPLRDKQFRVDLSRFVQSIGHDQKNTSPFHEPQSNFLPRGVMPSFYYSENLKKISAGHMRSKWSSKFKGKTFEGVFLERAFSKQFFKSFTQAMSDAGLNLNLRIVDGEGLMKAMLSKKYDFIGGRYIGNFPDPDGFVDPIREDSSLRYGFFPSGTFFNRIDNFKFEIDKRKRLSLYAETLKQMEKESYWVPLYRLRIPIIHNAKVRIPETNFRYEGELWKIFWKK